MRANAILKILKRKRKMRVFANRAHTHKLTYIKASNIYLPIQVVGSTFTYNGIFCVHHKIQNFQTDNILRKKSEYFMNLDTKGAYNTLSIRTYALHSIFLNLLCCVSIYTSYRLQSLQYERKTTIRHVVWRNP